MGKTILSFFHLGSFALSFGLVMFCDIMMMSVPLTGRIDHLRLKLMEKASRYVLLGLLVLIATGVGFIAHYWLFTPGALLNPKLYAKMTVVTVLSINGYWLHRRGLKILEHAQSHDLRRVEYLPLLRRLLTAGAISGISWWTAFVLGTFRELNFTVPFTILFGIYLVAIGGALMSVEGFVLWLKRGHARGVPIQADGRLNALS